MLTHIQVTHDVLQRSLEKGEIASFEVRMPGPDGYLLFVTLGARALFCVVSWGGGWDHVSAHVETAAGPDTPTWAEMDLVYRLLFHPCEPAMQLHVPPSMKKNAHNHTLHLWRPQRETIPLPPREFV